MLIARYAQLVEDTDQFKSREALERRRIAIYGLVSEIGSVISAVKKQRLGEGGTRDASEGLLARHELLEELGDVMWYCFALAALEEGQGDDILAQQLCSLLGQLSQQNEQSELFRKQLAPEDLTKFRRLAEAFPRKRQRTFRAFQEAAILTARTKDDQLVEVSLVVLMQLGAQLMRLLLPESERQLHNQLQEVTPLEILGRIAWHLSAIASVYSISLDECAKENIAKAGLRRSKDRPTPLHDDGWPDTQKFPRKFEVKFVTIGKGLSRMYFRGQQLGDDLKDNNYDPDGYRFHDALHLANIAHLGWSPVFRDMMKRKRKNDPKVDEVEDGARAKIIEEAILKVVHSEGSAIAEIVHPQLSKEQRPLFSGDIDIPLSFFKLIRRYAVGLEVEKNSFEEWKAAIRDGHRIYKLLVDEGQGTVSVDLEKRVISFSPEVYFDIAGPISGIGSHAVALHDFASNAQVEAKKALTSQELLAVGSDETALAVQYAAKRAVLRSLGLDEPTADQATAIVLTQTDASKFSVKSASPIQEVMWQRGVIGFKLSTTTAQNNVYCTALAVADVPRT